MTADLFLTEMWDVIKTSGLRKVIWRHWKQPVGASGSANENVAYPAKCKFQINKIYHKT